MTPGAVALGSRSIFILPTRHGLLFSLLLVALLLASVNYANALAYLLTFLLAGMALISILHTQRNLLGLELSVTGSDPVFAGEEARYQVCLRNPGEQRTAVRVESDGLLLPPVDIPPHDNRCILLAVPAPRRGWQDCPPLVISTHYPLGITRAWTRRQRLTARCLVYPQPADDEHALLFASDGADSTGVAMHDGDDFAGLRNYQSGDSPARISWKTLARGQGLHTKDFRQPLGTDVWIDWADFAPHDTELRLRLLTRAVLDADAAGLRYGLRLPTKELDPDLGATHRAACLEALALYETPPV